MSNKTVINKKGKLAKDEAGTMLLVNKKAPFGCKSIVSYG
ncbi:hypothetical protein ES705_36945 [subsurface metagenome]